VAGWLIYSSSGMMFGGADRMTISEMVFHAASQSNPGGSLWYGNIKSVQGLANSAFDAINNDVAPTPEPDHGARSLPRPVSHNSRSSRCAGPKRMRRVLRDPLRRWGLGGVFMQARLQAACRRQSFRITLVRKCDPSRG
jgi:hypothetical protein